MTDEMLLGPWVRRFLLEHLAAERNLARNMRLSYRDAFRLLLPFAARQLNTMVDRLSVADISADLVRRFLADLEDARHCRIASRNQRLAALHAFARFVGEHSPEHVAWCGQIRSVPFKNTPRPAIAYLEKPEIDALLAEADRRTAQGLRDYALMLLLYTSGAPMRLCCSSCNVTPGEIRAPSICCSRSQSPHACNWLDFTWSSPV